MQIKINQKVDAIAIHWIGKLHQLISHQHIHHSTSSAQKYLVFGTKVG
jgi:hypothetical protein